MFGGRTMNVAIVWIYSQYCKLSQTFTPQKFHLSYRPYLFSCIFIFLYIYFLPYLFSSIFIFLHIYFLVYIYFLPYLFSSIFILFHIYFLPYLFSSMLIFFHIYFLVYRLNHYKCLSYNYQGHLLNFNNTYNFILLI